MTPPIDDDNPHGVTDDAGDIFEHEVDLIEEVEILGPEEPPSEEEEEEYYDPSFDYPVPEDDVV